MHRLSFLAALTAFAPADNDPSSGGASPTGGSASAPSDAGAPAADGEQAKADEGQQSPGDVQPDKQADAPKTEPKPPEPELKLEVEPRETKARVELTRRAKDLDAREAKVKLAESDHSELARWRELKSMAQQDSISVLEELGITAETVFKHAKEGRQIDPTARKALAETAALKKQLAEREAAEKAAKEEEQSRAVRAKLDGQISALLKGDADRYELTLSEGKDGAELVHDALVAYTRKAGKPPQLEQAKKIADNVEKYYRDRADRYEASKYIKGKRNPPPPPKKQATDSKGLDNTLDASATAKPKGATSPGGTLAENREGYMAGIRSDWEAVKAEKAARAAKEAADGRK